ncbi:MAG: sigma-70 family RNA polymerase sigma factor [Nitrospinae bacterium]|nr:sigma-70 family RNA polymerase sigma factor [Nitrospinota bacterium]
MFSLAIPAWGLGLLEAPHEELDESSWIKRCQNGDRDAFEPLVRQNAGKIQRLVWGMLGERREDTDDVVQEIFIKAYFALPRFRGDAKFSTWVYRIAVNHCRDYLKRSGPMPLELSEEQIAGEPPPEDKEQQDALREVRERRASEELQILFSRLPEKHRRILVMRELEGMSYDEIGEVLQIRPGTVRSRLNRARANMLRAAESAKGEK